MSLSHNTFHLLSGVSVGAQLLALYYAVSLQYLHYAFIGAQSEDTGLDWFAMGTQNDVRGVGGVDNKAYKRQQVCAWRYEPEIPPSPQNSFGLQDSLFFLWLILCCIVLCLWSCGVDFFVSGTSSI